MDDRRNLIAGPAKAARSAGPAPDATALAERQARYGVLDLASQPVWIFDIDSRRVHWANAAALGVWRAQSLEELCARDMAIDMSESVAQRLAQYQSDFVANGSMFHEQWTLYPGGVPVCLSVSFSGHRLQDGRMAMLCQGEATATESPESLRSVEALLHTAVMITLFDQDGRPLYRNPAARRSVRELGETLASRIVDAQTHQRLRETLAREQVASCTAVVHTLQGERWHDISARLCRDAVSGDEAILVSESDVTALKHTEARANFLAMHDSLTGLPNRAHVMQRFREAIESIGIAGAQAALIFLDLDHFKNVNDALGHAAGDDLLVQIARRLRGVTRGTDLVARLGGDEFLVLVASADIRTDVEHVRRRIVRAVSQPVAVLGTEVSVTPSMGVSLYPQDGRDIETLLRNADLAMYCAKERGRNDTAYFDESMGAAVRTRTALEGDLRHALERGELEVYYQPRVNVRTNRIVGAEALVRWRHPERGLLGPDTFIPVCESTGLIRPVGMLVFEAAARQQAHWAAQGHPLTVSVNFSPRQFGDAQLAQALQDVLNRAGCNPEKIEVEITESLLMGTDDRSAQQLGRIKAMGMSIALDDFGTGYSNLAYLQRYAIDTIKIDKTFIQGIAVDRPLAEMIVSMSQLMDLNVVAEGVETTEQLSWIARRDIAQYQGFLFARPLPAAQFDALLQPA